MHLHLDPVGGVAGDMFAAAILDAFPELTEPLLADFEAAGLRRIVSVARRPHDDGILTGSRFQVEPADPETGHEHRHLDEIRSLISRTGLPQPVIARAVDIFERLADAESRVHGTTVDAVSFHEVGAWDSIADVITAAWLIERVGPATWSCGTLPLGRGRTPAGAHGRMPVPAPATALLLEGFPLAHLDEAEGERITPTGAAILRHLAPDFEDRAPPRRLRGTGIGFGTARMTGISNVLRVLVFDAGETAAGPFTRERIAECRFEVDDQTPEDLAVGLAGIRDVEGVLDVSHAVLTGKKGRTAFQVQVLARPEQLEAVLEACFTETTTLGVRWNLAERAALARTGARVEVQGGSVRLKRAARPGGRSTVKAEMDDVAALGEGHAGREEIRRQSAAAGLDDDGGQA